MLPPRARLDLQLPSGRLRLITKPTLAAPAPSRTTGCRRLAQRAPSCGRRAEGALSRPAAGQHEVPNQLLDPRGVPPLRIPWIRRCRDLLPPPPLSASANPSARPSRWRGGSSRLRARSRARLSPSSPQAVERVWETKVRALRSMRKASAHSSGWQRRRPPLPKAACDQKNFIGRPPEWQTAMPHSSACP